MEISASISDYWKIVEVKCEVVDEKVIRVLKFMNTFNMRKLISSTPYDFHISPVFFSVM
jgi:hypothetical protein